MASSVTNELPAALQTLVATHIDAFNTQDVARFLGVFGDTAVIVDGIPPYRWLNPNAPANWLADVEKWRAQYDVTYEHLSFEMGFWNVEGTAAYVVVLGTLTVTMKGTTVTRTGTLAYTFADHDGTWKMESQAWGRTS